MKSDRFEAIVQVLILLGIAGMAGAASFTHVHNWTMTNSQPGTGSWFGWANAVISDLTPTAAGIEIRRRKRNGNDHIAYPMTILIAAAVLSLSAQVAEARPTIGGWISSAVPALAFLALTKLILSRPSGPASEHQGGEQLSAMTASPAPAPGQTEETATAPVTTTTHSPVFAASSAPTPASAPSTPPGPDDTPGDNPAEPVPPPSGQLLMPARMTAFSHQQVTGQPITPGQLAERMNIPEHQAETLLRELGLDGVTPPPVTAVNGTVRNGSRP